MATLLRSKIRTCTRNNVMEIGDTELQHEFTGEKGTYLHIFYHIKRTVYIKETTSSYTSKNKENCVHQRDDIAAFLVQHEFTGEKVTYLHIFYHIKRSVYMNETTSSYASKNKLCASTKRHRCIPRSLAKTYLLSPWEKRLPHKENCVHQRNDPVAFLLH